MHSKDHASAIVLVFRCINPHTYIAISPSFSMQTILGAYKVKLKAQYDHYVIVTITIYAVQPVLAHQEDTVYTMGVVLLGQQAATKIANSFTRWGILAMKTPEAKKFLTYLTFSHLMHHHLQGLLCPHEQHEV